LFFVFVFCFFDEKKNKWFNILEKKLQKKHKTQNKKKQKQTKTNKNKQKKHNFKNKKQKTKNKNNKKWNFHPNNRLPLIVI